MRHLWPSFWERVDENKIDYIDKTDYAWHYPYCSWCRHRHRDHYCAPMGFFNKHLVGYSPPVKITNYLFTLDPEDQQNAQDIKKIQGFYYRTPPILENPNDDMQDLESNFIIRDRLSLACREWEVPQLVHLALDTPLPARIYPYVTFMRRYDTSYPDEVALPASQEYIRTTLTDLLPPDLLTHALAHLEKPHAQPTRGDVILFAHRLHPHLTPMQARSIRSWVLVAEKRNSRKNRR